CDTSVTWSGWYRLFINGVSAKIPDSCVAQYSCGTQIPLWIRGGHPTVQDGVVTRDVCGHWDNYCCYYGSYPIKVKACPGNYYVYELVRPTVCNSAYCAAVSSINTSPSVTPATISTAVTNIDKTITPETSSAVYTSVDPCYNYTVLDNPWRATNNTYASVRYCDQSVTWSGWYRLFINNMRAQIPDTCVAWSSCGTYIGLWIRGGHPKVTSGVVTRDVCGNDGNYCCYYGSFPIKVKACPGNYYVYELVSPTLCNLAYCAAVTNISTTDTKITPEPSSAVINITVPEGCTSQTSGECFQNLLKQIENITDQELSLNTVTNILTVAFNTSEKILALSSSANPTELASNGNRMLKTSEKLISTLVKTTDTSDSVNFTLPAV
ncbi:pancreatic secretory granule membrane major glycoprotein GP2-like, partial [Labeo rohita]|uniref:pancreatic secretory granule membrane major glycoprotein GP2-like n=1 Tax=Labeo rohita TaxID=84645 RepID=UPI0021E27183